MTTTNHTSPIGDDAANGAMGDVIDLLERARYVRNEDLPAKVREEAETRAAYGNRSAWADARDSEQRRLIDDAITILQARAALTAEKVAGQEAVSDTHINLFRPNTGDVFKALRTDSIDELLQDGWEISSQSQPAQSAEQDERAARDESVRGEVAYQLQMRNRFLDMPTTRAIVDSAFNAAIAKNTLPGARAASTQSTATQPVEAGRALTGGELAKFEQTLNDFAEYGETETDYQTLLGWAQRGLLDCTRFTPTEAGRALLSAQPASGGEA